MPKMYYEQVKYEALPEARKYLDKLMNLKDIKGFDIKMYPHSALVGISAEPQSVNTLQDKFKNNNWRYKC